MPAAFRIAGKDFRLRVRDRSVFITGILAPLLLSYIFYLVFGPAVAGPGGLSLEYGMVDEDGSEISLSLIGVLEGAETEDILELTIYEDRSAADSALADGEIDAFFLVPEGLQAEVTRNQTTTVEVIGDVDAPTSTQIAASFVERFSSGVAASQLAVATTATLEGVQPTPDFLESLSRDPAAASMVFTTVDETAATKQLDAPTYFAAGMAMFFLFFTVQFGVAGLLEEERDGTLARLMIAPIGRVSVIAGKGILSFVLGIISMTVLAVMTTLLMGADWGSPVGVALLVAAGVLAAVGIMGLVASVAKAPEGAGIIAVILGMLGGTFFPVASGGGFLSALTYSTPHAWFMLGLAELGSDAPWTEALPAAGAMMMFALVTGLAGYLLLRRRLAR